jgi:hypothetical protein
MIGQFALSMISRTTGLALWVCSDIWIVLQQVFKSLNYKTIFVQLSTTNYFDLAVRAYIVLVLMAKFHRDMLVYAITHIAQCGIRTAWWTPIICIIAAGLVSVLFGTLASWVVYGDIDDLYRSADLILFSFMATLSAFIANESDDIPINF